MLNVVTYCRVSSDEQAFKDLSIPAQRKQLHKWVEERADHVVVKEFVDEGESAYAPANKRPGFCEMVTYCRKAKVSAILVHKLDRFSRDREESILFKSLLKQHGVLVKSVSETYDPETPSGFLYEGMIEVINQFYSMNLATETLKGMKENAERGWVNGGRIPYGYRVLKVADAKGREHGELILADEKAVGIVREIFDMASNQGMGVKAIANELNRRGIPAPRCRHWSGSSLDTLLNNRAYLGDAVWFKSRKVGRDKRKRTEEDDRIVVENAHPPIIDRDTFARRQALAKERRFDCHTSASKPVSYLLSRLIVCGGCGHHFGGRRMVSMGAGGVKLERFAYYCGGYLNNGTTVCAALPIPKAWIEGTVLKIIKARLCEPDALADLEDRVRARVEAERRALGTDSRVINAKIADLDRRIDFYFKAIGEGMEVSRCKTAVAELNREKDIIEREAGLVRREDHYRKAIDKNLAELRRYAGLLATKFDDLPLPARRELILHFIEKVGVKDRRMINIHFKVPFDPDGVKFLAEELMMPSASVEGGGETGKSADLGQVSHCRSGTLQGATLQRRFFESPATLKLLQNTSKTSSNSHLTTVPCSGHCTFLRHIPRKGLDMTWTVQKQKRKERGYYSAVFTPAHGERRSVTLGYLPGDPVTAAMTARLRRFDPHGHWQKDTLVSVLAASTDETAAQAAIFRPMMSEPLSALVPRDLSPAEERALLSMMALDLAAGRGGWYDAVKNTTLTALAEQIGKLDPPAPVPPAAPAAPIVVVAPPPPPRPVIVPPDPRGAMTLDRYFQEVWAPIRRLTASWKRDAWWFDYRILPVLGEVRICDLNEPAWTALLQGLTVSGSSKRLCQNAYRCALTHAVDNLGWVAQLHRFKPIPGSTKAALAEPEPLEHVEVTALLNAAPSAMHRALFGTQIGQGLRPKEVIRLKWEHVNWRARTLYVEGTKNQLAAATVAMTPRTLQALRPWWEERGRPLDGPMFVSGETLKPLEEFPKAVLRRAAERAGLNDDRKRKVFPYLARHTFATLAAADGIQPAHTRRMMRHSSASSVMERAYEKATLKQVSGAFATFGREGDGAWDW